MPNSQSVETPSKINEQRITNNELWYKIDSEISL